MAQRLIDLIGIEFRWLDGQLLGVGKVFHLLTECRFGKGSRVRKSFLPLRDPKSVVFVWRNNGADSAALVRAFCDEIRFL